MKARAWDFAAWAQSGVFSVHLPVFFPPEASFSFRRAHYAPCRASRRLIFASRLRFR